MKRILILTGMMVISAAACWSAPPPTLRDQVGVNTYDEEEYVPGVVDRLWAEPMYNYARIPAQVDPNEVYYRPSYETLIEVREERYQKAEYPPAE
jgi:hypothetical protein